MFVVELLSRVLPLQLGDSFLSSVGTEVKIQRTTLLAGSLLVRLPNPLVSYPTRWSLSFVLGPLCIDHQHISYIQGTKKYSAVMYYQPTCWCQAGTLSALCCSQSPFLICTPLLLRRWYEIMALYYVKSILTEISASRQDRRVLQKSKIIRIEFLSKWGMLQTSRYV